MAAYSIVRIQKLKSWGAVAGAVSHNTRQRETPNANPAVLAKNRFLIGSPDDDPVAACKARLGGQRIRKNAVYGVDGFLGASPEYFRPGSPNQYGAAEQDRLEAWIEASVKWLQDQYGDRIINAVLHLDEATPHIQFLILPLDDNGKLNCRAMFGGKKYVLSQLQSDYAQAVAHLGLTRGREGSKASHTEVAEYYAATQQVEPAEGLKLPAVEDLTLPEPPGTIDRMKTKNLVDYAKAAIENHVAALEPVLTELSSRNSILAAENARLKQEREQLKDSNSRLTQDNAEFKAHAKQMRELSLDRVLCEMYGAIEAPESKPKHLNRNFTLPDGLTITFSGNEWQEDKTKLKGKGAINLVMHLSGYGKDNYKQTVRDMMELFGDQEAAGSLAAHLLETAPREAREIAKLPVQMPKPVENTWPFVREYLLGQLQLPAPLIDSLHYQGLVFSDRRRNCVFPRDKGSGVFKVGTGTKPFNQTLGKDGEPFFMPGTDGQVYITDSPLEALALKAMHPDSSVLATGGYMPINKIKPYTDQREVFIAMSQDKFGNQMADYLAKHLPKAKKLAPDQRQSWRECWKLQLKEREREEGILAEQITYRDKNSMPGTKRRTDLVR